MANPWFVYMLECADGSLYTGTTTDPKRRLREHNGGTKGARYTKTRRPVSLVYVEEQVDRSAALKREWALKNLSRTEKKLLQKK
jgi:putative endonuclease